jgi:hypothetical protein
MTLGVDSTSCILHRNNFQEASTVVDKDIIISKQTNERRGAELTG